MPKTPSTHKVAQPNHQKALIPQKGPVRKPRREKPHVPTSPITQPRDLLRRTKPRYEENFTKRRNNHNPHDRRGRNRNGKPQQVTTIDDNQRARANPDSTEQRGFSSMPACPPSHPTHAERTTSPTQPLCPRPAALFLPTSQLTAQPSRTQPLGRCNHPVIHCTSHQPAPSPPFRSRR